MLAAIRQDFNSNKFNIPHDFPEALQYASKELRNDPEVVLEALEAFGRMLGSDEVLDKEDPGQNPLKWASKELRADRGFMLEAQQRLENAIGFLDERKYWGPNLEGALAYASKELCADKNFMLNAIRQSKYGYDLFYASTNLKNDHELVFEAVCKSADALKYAPKELRDNRDFLRSAIKRKPSIIQYVSVDLSDDVNPVSRIKIKILKSL